MTPIVCWPATVLDNPTRPVTEFGEKLTPLLDQMYEAMKNARGIGIAANQIGVDLSVAWVVREGVSEDEDGAAFEIVNPIIMGRSDPVVLEEGCLSVPGVRETVPRFGQVQVNYQDRNGVPHALEAEGHLAHVLQHEIDHLNGIVYVKHLSQLKRGFIQKKLAKMRSRR